MAARWVLRSLTVLWFLVASAALADPSGRPNPRSKTHGVFLADSAYAALSAAPIESLSERQFEAWLRERQLRLSLAAARVAYPGWSIARPWPKAQASFLSDSAYVALSAMPVDSLGDRDYEMLVHERQLRALWPPGVKGHAILMTDASYEALSSMELDSLTDRQYDLLTRERQLRAPKPEDPSETHLLGFVAFLGALGGFAAGLLLVAGVLAHAW